MPALQRERDLPRVIAAEGISNFGSMLSRLAIPWVATLMLGATPAAMAWLLVADVLVGAIGAWLLGPLIECSPKRAAILCCDGLREASGVTAPREAAVSPWAQWRREQRDAWRTLLDHPSLRALAAVEALRAFGFALAGTSYMIYVTRDLALPTGIQGMVFALGAVGAIAGAAVAPRPH